MLKAIVSIFLLNYFAFAFETFDKENSFTVKVKNQDFKTLYIKLKDEINFNSFVIVKELDLAKSTSAVALALEKKALLKNGKNLLLCKSSFTYEMIKENILNISFCPMGISIYENSEAVFISYRKYKPLRKEDKIASKVNETLKTLILNSLE